MPVAAVGGVLPAMEAQPSSKLAHPPVVRALGVEADDAPGQVAQTAGGLLDSVFGGSTGSKDEEDGRRAFPLPPPDPSTVNWAGVPYHAPKPSAVAASPKEGAAPLRDVAADTSTPNRSINSPSGATSATPSQSIARRNTGLPQVPAPPAVVKTFSSPPTSARIADGRVAGTARSPVPTQSNLSSNSSSRRDGRKPITPLITGKVPTPPPSAAVAAQPAGELKPGTQSAPTRRSVANVDTLPPRAAEITSEPSPEQRPTVPALPPSLNGLPIAQSSPQRRAIPQPPPETVAKAEPKAAVPEATMALPDAAGITELEVPSAPSPDQLATLDLMPPTAEKVPTEPLSQDPITGTATPLSPIDDSGVAAVPTAEEPSAEQDFLGSGVASEQIASRYKPRPAGVINSPAALGGVIDPSGELRISRPKQLAVSEAPGVKVVTEGPAEILIRQVTQYEVRVENRGSADATGVVVRTSLPPWAALQGQNASAGTVRPTSEGGDGQIEWTIDSIPAGTVERLFVRVQASKAGTFDVATRWTTAARDQTAQVTVREPKLAVQIDGPDEIVFGQSQRYKIRVLNPGDGPASNVVFTLKPDAADPVNQRLGNIPAGKESSFEIELTARDRGSLGIRGDVTGDLDLTAEANKSVEVVAADLEASLSGLPVQFQNAEAIYGLEVMNVGRVASEAVKAELQIPSGMTYIGGINGAKLEGDRLHWTIASVPPGETRQFSFNCQLEQTGNPLLTFRCVGSAGGEADVQLETAVEAIVDLKLSVQDPPAPAPVGSEVIYEVVIHNHGSMAAENVRVVGQFGHGIEPMRTDGQSGEISTGQVLFSPIPRIEAGGEFKIKIIAKAEAAGDHRFRAEVHSGETVLVAEEATIFVDMTRQRVSSSSSTGGGLDAPR